MTSRFNRLLKLFAFTATLVLPAHSYAATVKTGIDEQAQLPFWEIREHGMSLRLVQRLPIQTRAFFLARGFNKQQVEIVAQSCVFQTVFKNTSNESGQASPLSYNLNDWQVIHEGKVRHMKVRKQWDEQWIKDNVKKPQRLAFEWALYPTTQTYQPGDYNWGMSTFNLKPGENFDLNLVWQQYGKQHSKLVKGIQCAKDVNPQPTDTY
ncbi:MAG: hypothetical protein P8Y24_09940 [Gammaproteobacteria bacterium]